MKESDLPDINRILGSGPRLRSALTVAINEALGEPTGAAAKRLDDLLAAARAFVQTVDDVTAPTVVSRTQAAGANVVVITFSEGLDYRQVPAAAAFALSPARTITGVEIVGTTLRLTYSGASYTSGNSPTVGYTQPAATAVRLQDPAGNLVATFAPAAITVS